MKNSASLPRFSRGRIRQAMLACATLIAIVTLAAYWVFRQGYILYYGDAQSHLNLSRSILDSRTPGYDQLGTVWLPILHVICLPFVDNMNLWSTGLAGTIPVACCFVIAGMAFFFAALETYRSSIAAWAVILCFALNPNLLYLATIPMTEVVFLCGGATMLLALVRFEANRRPRFVALGVVASWWMSLTRYDGWFLIPFAAVWFAWSAWDRKWRTLFAFAVPASLAPLYWIAHNWWETSNALDFYNGPYSALTIQGGKPYPGYHDWAVAAWYYAKAGQLCCGWTLVLLGLTGFLFALAKGTYRPLLFLLLTPAFYIWSIHSSGNPIFLPQLPSQGYYNSRYGIAVIAYAAFATGALVKALSGQQRKFGFVIPVVAILPWLFPMSNENWICWKESQVNSESRRAWTKAGADFLRQHYVMGQGILTPSASGDLVGIFCKARIPLDQTINVGNGPLWMANTERPDLIHQKLWVVEQDGDALARDLSDKKSPYSVAREIAVEGAPKLEILRRIH